MSGLEVGVSIECPEWAELLPDAEARCQSLARAAVAAGSSLGDSPCEISIVLADDATVRTMNREWRGKDAPTNVLSFAALDDEDAPVVPDAPVLLGDIILALGVCRSEAEEQGKSLSDHFSHLVVHGVLHLLGWDHEEDDIEADQMESLEISILTEFGIADPYRTVEDDGPTVVGKG